MVAEWMPGFLNAGSFPVENVLAAFAYGKSGILGLPAEVTGDVLIGYLIFGSIILNCGAGDFFVRFALSVFGRFRGGSAKVAIMTSALFGMMSGSPIANAVTTGTLTIPTMKRYGYPPHYAGAIEAVAGNGGIIMPPVMGTVIFIMVILTGVTYAEVVIAALLPAILYYAGLFVQVDAYAAKSGLVGIPKAEIPSLRSALKMGWPTIIVIGFLVYALMFLRWSQTAPVFAAGLAILLSFTSRKYRMTPRKLLATTINMGETIAFIMATVLPAAYIILGLDLTGTVMAITARIVSMAEGSTILVLALAALLCYIFGFIGLSIVPYIVLAVTMVPAMVKGAGLDLVSVHLFLIYWLITANITPPVAILAFVCAAIAGAPPMKTGWTATRLAIVVYFVPFFFVLNPALILKGPVELIILYFVTALAGIWVLGSGMEGYLQFLGLLPWWSRVMLIIGGFLLAFPDWILTIVGLAIIAVAVLAILAIKRFKAARPAPG
jgi:TRAP transporter 4TM/12TM fusion protein